MHRVVWLRNVGLTVPASRGSEEPKNTLAPEWVFNLPITSKANVYSYGIKVLDVTPQDPLQGRDGHFTPQTRRLKV